MEKDSEKLKMGLDAQESFAQMHEDRNMNKGIVIAQIFNYLIPDC